MSQPPPQPACDQVAEGRGQLARFLAAGPSERVFTWPTCHPSGKTGFCWCERGMATQLWFYARAILLDVLLKLPFDGLKTWYLRRLGATVGRNVHFSPGTWIDPMFPQLVTLEDDVFLGMGARIFTHEFGIDSFRAGRVIIRRGALIGAAAIIRSGVEVGEYADVAAGAVLGRDVPAGATAIGNVARIIKPDAGRGDAGHD